MSLYMMIVIKENVPVEYAVVGAAHASLAGFLKWKDDDLINKWVNSTFYKYIKIANDTDFEKCKMDKYGEKIILTESSLNNEEIAIVYRMKEDYPQFLKSLKRWSYHCENEDISNGWPP